MIYRKIKHLEMMGYHVYDDVQNYRLEVSLTTNKGFCALVSVSYDELRVDFCIESVVKILNERIRRNL